MTKIPKSGAVASASADDMITGTASFGAPGKRTLTGDRAEPTGNAYIDRGNAACGGVGGPGCVLSDDQRSRLVTLYVARVTDASSSCRSALVNLRTDALLDKSDDDFPVFASLVLDFIGSFALARLSDVVKAMRKTDDKRLDAIRGLLTHAESKEAVQREPLHEAMLTVAENTLPTISKMVVDKVKKAIPELARPGSSSKAEKSAYIRLLANDAMLAFAALRETPPGLATDGQMLGLYEAFAPQNHLQSAYEDGLRDKLDRFMHSGVGAIGRGRGSAADPDAAAAGSPEAAATIRDVVVVRALFVSGHPPAYMLASSRWKPTWAFAGYTGVQLDEPLPMVRSEWKGHDLAATTAKPYGEIAPEFTELAIARHRQTWGADPETITVDESTWFWNPARAHQARLNKEHPLPSSARRATP